MRSMFLIPLLGLRYSVIDCISVDKLQEFGEISVSMVHHMALNHKTSRRHVSEDRKLKSHFSTLIVRQ